MQNYQPGRLISLDVYRGIIMILLVAESAAVYNAVSELAPDGTFGSALVSQFFHHPWNGLRFWDLIQPFFMFIVGVAMPFSLKGRLEAAMPIRAIRWHIIKRCLWLFLFGVGLHCVYQQQLVWELWNVLTQLSFAVLLAFLVIKMPFSRLFFVSFLLLVIAEIAYRAYDPAAPYSREANFGMWMDMILMGKVNADGWVAINCIPTAAHTIWGVICGKLLLSKQNVGGQLRFFFVMGASLLFAGYALGYTCTPIIKRIATSSFVLVSGGYAVLALAFFYWVVDIKHWRSWAWICVVVGANSIFIYLFSQLLGTGINQFVAIFSTGTLAAAGLSGAVVGLINGLVTFMVFWYVCYFLYRKGMLFRI